MLYERCSLGDHDVLYERCSWGDLDLFVVDKDIKIFYN